MDHYSNNAAIDGIGIGDTMVEVRGYVDAEQRPKTVGKIKKLNIFKFVINNGAGRRIQCLAWESEVKRFAEIIETDKIYHIEGAKAVAIKDQQYNSGNMPFELVMQQGTEITCEGTHNFGNSQNVARAKVVTWDEIAETEGAKVTITGWIKLAFREARYRTSESTYRLGCLTNGQKKLEVRVISSANFAEGLTKGVEVKITGTPQFSNYLYLKVESGADVILTQGAPLPSESMLNITLMPQKTPKAA